MTGPQDPVAAPGAGASGTGTHVAVLMTQIATAEALAAACAVHRAPVDVVVSPIGAYAVCREPFSAADVARDVSALVKTVPLILVEAKSGQISAGQWLAGERTGDLPPGLVLDGAPHELEDILLGAVAVTDLENVVTSVGMSRWKAMRSLAATARTARGRR